MFYGAGNEKHQFETGYFVHHRIVSAVKKVDFVNNTMSYTVQRGHWCNAIILNVHVTSEERSDDSKDSFMEIGAGFLSFA